MTSLHNKLKLAALLFSGFILAVAMLLLSSASAAFAQNSSGYVETGAVQPDDTGGLVQCGNKANDPCTVEDVFNIFVIATNLLVGVVGLVTIFSIFEGAWMLVTSSGNTEGVTAGRHKITNSLWGMFMVLLAFVLINVIIYGLAAAKPDADIFNPLEYIGLSSNSQRTQTPTPMPNVNTVPFNNLPSTNPR